MDTTYQHHFRRRIVEPFEQFVHAEQSSGLVLAFSVVVAMVLAHSPWSETYSHLLHAPIEVRMEGFFATSFSLAHVVNDGLMSLFFFVVGLELKREAVGGELRHLRSVMLPVGAALFGMLLPSAIYLLFNHGTPQAQGWGIPMATDIAFALAVVYALGKRLPLSAKVFLTTLAIVDDLGSVLVIAFFYTSHISLMSVAMGFLFLALMWTANRLGVKSVVFYGVVGIGGVWTAFLFSGIHATIAAVLAAWMIPADTPLGEGALMARLRRSLRHFERAQPNDVPTLEEEQLHILTQVQQDTQQAIPPLQRLEHGLHPLVAFIVMPLFALSNAGLSLTTVDASALLASPVVQGVALGLLVGKPLGVLLGVWLFCRLGLGVRPRGMTWRRLLGLGCLASIGFTMSIFVTTLAFSQPHQVAEAKVGIFVASVVGASLGYSLLRKAR